MAIDGWIVDKSASARLHMSPYREQVFALPERLFICAVAELEVLYSARSGRDYDERKAQIHSEFQAAIAPVDILDRALVLQHDLAHRHGLWHRVPIADLLIAETAMHNNLGVAHVDGDFERIAEVRPLTVRRLG